MDAGSIQTTTSRDRARSAFKSSGPPSQTLLISNMLTYGNLPATTASVNKPLSPDLDSSKRSEEA